jgi:hypothetical protein
MSPRIKTLIAIRARPEPVREPFASAFEAIGVTAGNSEAETASGALSCPNGRPRPA